MVDLLTLALVM